MSERTGWCVGHVTPTLDNLVSVNAIAVITTAYTMKWQKVLTSSGSHVRCVCDDVVRQNASQVLGEMILL